MLPRAHACTHLHTCQPLTSPSRTGRCHFQALHTKQPSVLFSLYLALDLCSPPPASPPVSPQGERISFEERDVVDRPVFRRHLRAILPAGFHLPQLFVCGHLLGSADDVLALHEEGLLAPVFAYLRAVQQQPQQQMKQ